MRALSLMMGGDLRIATPKLLLLEILLIGLPSLVIGAPQVKFDPSSLTVTPSATAETPPIVIQNAGGISSVTLNITIPPDIVLDTTTSGSGMACVAQGSSTEGLFFAEWNSAQRKISITCTVGSATTLEIVKSIEFTAPSSVTTEEFELSGTITGGSGSAAFTSLTILPPHTVTFTTNPNVSAAAINSGGSTNCSAAAVDSHGHTVAYAWSDGDKGGSFNPNSSSQNPTYTVPTNMMGADMSVTLTCTAACSQSVSIKATGQASLTVRSRLAGDVDKDNDVDKTDADLVLQYLFGDIAKTSEMDANGDGSVTIADAQWILAHLQTGK